MYFRFNIGLASCILIQRKKNISESKIFFTRAGVYTHTHTHPSFFFQIQSPFRINIFASSPKPVTLYRHRPNLGAGGYSGNRTRDLLTRSRRATAPPTFGCLRKMTHNGPPLTSLQWLLLPFLYVF